MTKQSKSNFSKAMRLSMVALSVSVFAGCATGPIQGISSQSLKDANTLDAAALRKNVEPIVKPLTLDEALARALKYNLDRRAKFMDDDVALGQGATSKYAISPTAATW